MVRDAEQFAEDDKKRREAAEAKNNADSLIHTTERQLVEHGDKIDAALKTEIEEAIAATKAAVESNEPEAMKEKAAASPSADGEAPKADEDVVDAEFSEVEDDKK